MSLSQQIDVYCERTDFTFWSEPLNAISNIAFLIAAWFCYRLYISGPPYRDIYSLLLIIMLVLTGTGSFLFHTFATRWAGMADIIPIAGMVLIYHLATMHKIARFPLSVAWGSIIIIPLLSVSLSAILPDTMGASQAYAPVFVLFTGYTFFHWRNENRELWLLPLAIFIFGMSLTMRVLDGLICDIFTYGVHYLWHILNSITLYLAFRAYNLNCIIKKI